MTKKKAYQLTQSQKMMIFILSMSLYGLSNMFTELIPSVQLGVIELSVEYFAFIPLTLCILFHPLYAAVGAALGEIIFGELNAWPIRWHWRDRKIHNIFFRNVYCGNFS